MADGWVTDRELALILERLEMQHQAQAKALDLQAREYERRLEALNGEATRLAADRARFVSRETYDVTTRDFGSWRDMVNTFMATERGRERGSSLVWGVVVAGFGVVLGVAGLLVALAR